MHVSEKYRMSMESEDGCMRKESSDCEVSSDPAFKTMKCYRTESGQSTERRLNTGTKKRSDDDQGHYTESV